MEPHPKSDQKVQNSRLPVGDVLFCLLLAGVAVGLLFKARSAHAREAESEAAAPVPCALLVDVAGQVDVLDSSRSHLLVSSKSASVPCGGWISVGKGSAELRHRDGFTAHVGPGTFVQLLEPNVDGKNGGDHLILFRGEIFGQAASGSQELRVVTANARARVNHGSAIVVYNNEDEETQLIALDSASSLENRFEPSRKVTARAGEATSLNFRQLRVVPSSPRAVALAALRPKFEALRVPERDRVSAVRSAQNRQERVFATALVDGKEGSSAEAKAAAEAKANRQDEKDVRTASTEAKKSDSPGGEVRERLKKSIEAQGDPKSYSNHADPEQVAAVRKHWVSRLVAGQAGAEKIVNPVVSAARKPASQAGEGEGLAAHGKARRMTTEDEEKLKLIDELSRVHDDE